MKTNSVEKEKDLGNAFEDLKTKQPEWRYVETSLAAEVEAGDIRLRPHWKGTMDASAIREVVRKAAAAPALYAALAYVKEVSERQAAKDADDSDTVNITVTVGWLREVAEAIALVDGSTPKDEDERCPDCGKTPDEGACFYCKMD